jgi:hypothetical protein
MILHRPVAHAGCFGPVDPACSPACRGWLWGKIKTDRTSEDVKYRKTNPRKADPDCLKSFCDHVLNSFRASVGSHSKATHTRRPPAQGRVSLSGSSHGIPRNKPLVGRTTEDANWPKQSHRITTQLLSNSSLAITYIIGGEKSPEGQTQPFMASSQTSRRTWFAPPHVDLAGFADFG